ncbi:unnamed protein product [Parajaminaea phylloscopi]
MAMPLETGRMEAPAAASAADSAQSLTSFGFLDEGEDREERTYGLGQLLTRVKTAFVGSTSRDTDSRDLVHSADDRQAEDTTTSPVHSPVFHARTDDIGPSASAVNRLKTAPRRSVSTQARPVTGLTPAAKLARGNPRAFSVSGGQNAAPNIRSGPGQGLRQPLQGDHKKPHAPFKSVQPALAITSTAPLHAMSHHASAHTAADMSADFDTHSIGPDHIGDSENSGPWDNALGHLGLLREANLESYLPWTSVPGFPLSRDILADDSQSIRSTPSRRQGSEPSLEQRLGDPAATSLQMSAEAFRRLTLKGGAAQSKEWWMPDASAKECSSCGSTFTLARRRHHCRCCGQIFCAKCASNLLPGSKLGLPDVVRVCDFCTKMLKEYEKAQNSAQRELHKPARHSDGRVKADLISAPLEAAVGNAPQGRFAANALFGASALARELPAEDCAASVLHHFSSNEDFEADPDTAFQATSRTGGVNAMTGPGTSDNPPPFRQRIIEEEQAFSGEGASTPLSGVPEDEDGSFPSPHLEFDDDTMGDRKSSVAFPTTKGDIAGGKTSPHSVLYEARARLASDVTLSHESRVRLVSEAAIRAFRRSRLRSRVTVDDVRQESPKGWHDDVVSEARPSSRSGANTSHDLDPEGLDFLRRLCAQCLARSNIPRAVRWLEVLLPLTTKVVQYIHPQILAHGKLMGIRRYIKIKRIPGGTIDDCHLASGYICSRNVAAKSMLRRLPLKNARVILLAFPLTAIRSEGHYVSLETLSASEREYTRILVGRILSLRPNLLVTKDQVSRLALEQLDNAGVVVVSKVPESSMSAISRVTQAEIVTSADRLALRPRLGRCGTFAVDTYHSEQEASKRRSFLHFSGTAKHLGCSFVLRGGGQELLGKVKAILELLLLAAYNMRLEQSMKTAQLSLIPSPTKLDGELDDPKVRRVNSEDDEMLPGGLRSTVDRALQGHNSTMLSISRDVKIPPPFPLLKLHQDAANLRQLELEQDDAGRTQARAGDNATSYNADASPEPAAEKQSTPEDTTDDCRGEDDGNDAEKPTTASEAQHSCSVEPTLDESCDLAPQVALVLPSDDQMKLKTRLALASARHEHDAKYIMRALKETSEGTPFTHQCLPVLHSSVSSASMRPCEGPRVIRIEFYGAGDSTIADHLDSKCNLSSHTCKAKSCGLQRILHFDSYVHNDVRVQIFCERFVCPIAGQENSLLTWEYCKVCEAATPVSVVHEEAKAYSWAKFLEAHFYTHRATAECKHELLTDRIRYFAYKNLAFRVHVERIYPLDIVVPGLRLFMRPDVQSHLTGEEAVNLARRADCYFHSVAARLKALEHELTLGREGVANLSKYGPTLQEIRQVAIGGRKEVNDLTVLILKKSDPSDSMCLNQIRRKLQGVVVSIDKLFTAIERHALPKERDVRRLTSSHLSRLFLEKEALEAAGVDPPSALQAAAQQEDAPVAEGTSNFEPERSVSLLARVADTAALGLAPYIPLPMEEYTSLTSALNSPNPDSAARGCSKPSSAHASAVASGAPTPVNGAQGMLSAAESSPEDTPSISMPGSSPSADRPTAADQTVNDSESGSSPTKPFKTPLVRPRPRKAVSSWSLIEDHAGEHKHGHGHRKERHGTSDAESKLRGGPAETPDSTGENHPPNNNLAKHQQGGSGTSERSREATDGMRRVFSDSEARKRGRPISPAISRSGPTRRAHGQASTVGVSEHDKGAPQATKAPPSSYRAPPTRAGRGTARMSESESDVASSQGQKASLGKGTIRGPGQRPALSRRASGKSDSGNESAATALSRRLPKRIMSPVSALNQRNLQSVRLAQGQSRVPLPANNAKNRVSTIANHFNRINRESEREREKQRRALALRARRALPISASTARVAQYSSVTAAVESDESSSDEDEERKDQSGKEAQGCQSDDGGDADSEDENGVDLVETSTMAASPPQTSDNATKTQPLSAALDGGCGITTVTSSSQQAIDEAKTAGLEGHLPATVKDILPATSMNDAHEKGSLLKTISSLWGSRPGAALPLLEYPLTNEQHLFADSPLLLRDDEPSSLIAFTLVSIQYQERLRSLRATARDASDKPLNTDAPMASAGKADGSESTAQVERSLRRPDGVHLRFDFVSGASRFHCRILFAEQFDALRTCCGCQDSLIASLARCVKWDSAGGKSGMTFLKTRDDRLVLKQLSSAELASFSTFAPHYFAHMADCLMHGKPTTLAKIFGLYRISTRNSATGKAYKLDVLVMENLFYGRQCTRIFDLKGSMRNRYVNATGAPGEVLLDENLVEISHQRPLYIREASKSVLRRALKHDSDFLADMNIMDYSVIVGVDTSDDQKRELVVGIIDFLRSYTWDKRVETFVKEQSALLGATKGELPTVITPKQYANRFLSFLDGILLLSPDSWYQEQPLQAKTHQRQQSADTTRAQAV